MNRNGINRSDRDYDRQNDDRDRMRQGSDDRMRQMGLDRNQDDRYGSSNRSYGGYDRDDRRSSNFDQQYGYGQQGGYSQQDMENPYGNDEQRGMDRGFGRDQDRDDRYSSFQRFGNQGRGGQDEGNQDRYGQDRFGGMGSGSYGSNQSGMGRSSMGGSGQDYGSSMGRSGYGSNQSGYVQSGQTGGQHAGKGPKGYQRDPRRIEEEINERLMMHPGIDASEIEVRVENGEVTLTGTVSDRNQKRMAEECAEGISGVQDVHNQIRVQREGQGLLGGLASGIQGMSGQGSSSQGSGQQGMGQQSAGESTTGQQGGQQGIASSGQEGRTGKTSEGKNRA